MASAVVCASVSVAVLLSLLWTAPDATAPSSAIQLPMGYQLVGFGPGQVVFLSNRDAKGLHLSRVQLKPLE